MENRKEQSPNKSSRRASDQSADAAADDMNLETLLRASIIFKKMMEALTSINSWGRISLFLISPVASFGLPRH